MRQGVEERLSKIEADLLCELVGVSNIIGFSKYLFLIMDCFRYAFNEANLMMQKKCVSRNS